MEEYIVIFTTSIIIIKNQIEIRNLIKVEIMINISVIIVNNTIEKKRHLILCQILNEKF